jgi:hypothetical protein
VGYYDDESTVAVVRVPQVLSSGAAGRVAARGASISLDAQWYLNFRSDVLDGDIRQICVCPNYRFGHIGRIASGYMTFWGDMDRLDLPISLGRGY